MGYPNRTGGASIKHKVGDYVTWGGKRGRIARVSGSRAFVRLIADNRMPTGEEEEVSLAALSPTQPTERRNRSQAGLELRTTSAGTIRARASNDQVVDHYGKVITVESLHDWWEGYKQHRTVSLQHDMDLRGIQGKPQVAVALDIDFTPQLEVSLRVFDEETQKLIQERKIGSVSLEFVPLGEEVRVVNGEEVGFYYRLSSEPEHCGLGLVDIPGVPESDILEIRTMTPSWAYAVVDPVVLSGKVSDPAKIAELRYLPHHNLKTRMVDEDALARSLRDLDTLSVPAEASLSAEEVKRRAVEHLSRHTVNGIAMRSASAKGDDVNKWIKARMNQYIAEGMSEDEARKRATSEYNAQPEVRARVEGTQAFEGFARNSLDLNINVRSEGAQPQEEQQATQQAQPQQQGAQAQQDAQQSAQNGEGQASEDANTQQPNQTNPDVSAEVERQVRAMLAQPENPMAAIAAGLQVRSRKLEPDELLGEVLFRTVARQMDFKQPSAQDRQEVDNILKASGIDTRALTIEGNGTVIREELARQFVVRPQDDIIGRNHFASLPMRGTKKTDFPVFDERGLEFEWNRPETKGSLGNIDDSDPTVGTFSIEVAELNGKTNVPDSFVEFNASGPAYVQGYLLPALRGAAQREEDRAFFLSRGVHPDPRTFEGIMRVTGATVVVASPNGDPYTLDLLSSLLRAMPKAFRKNPRGLGFYLPTALADDHLDELEARKTPMSDAVLERYANIPGPAPVAVYRSVPIFSVPQLPDDETQGSNSDAGTISLLPRTNVAIGDALSIKIEPYRAENFVTKLQIQEFVGLGYQFLDAIVRRPGVRPRSAA